MVIRLRDLYVHGVNELGFGAEPIIEFTAGPPALAFKNLECSSSNRIMELFDPVEDTRRLFYRYCFLDVLHCCGGLRGHKNSPFQSVWMAVQPVKGLGAGALQPALRFSEGVSM